MSERTSFFVLLESPLRSLYLCMLWKKSTAKNCCPVSLLSVISKIFEKLVNNRLVDNSLVDHLEKYGIFLEFQYSFKSFQSHSVQKFWTPLLQTTHPLPHMAIPSFLYISWTPSLGNVFPTTSPQLITGYTQK